MKKKKQVSDLELIQRHQLDGLLDHGYHTAFGKKYAFKANWSYEQFKNNVPVCTYEAHLPFINAAKKGKPNQLWEGTTTHYAISSGTYSHGKHLPVTRERLRSDQLFMQQIALHALKWLKSPSIFFGKQLSLPGSVKTEKAGTQTIKLGEISGLLAQSAPNWLKWFQVISPESLLHVPFEEKLERLVDRASEQDIRAITAVPSWLLIIFQKILQKSGQKTVNKVWPNLKLLICGGVAVKNYAHAFRQLCGQLPLLIETYGASEGFFAFGRYDGSGEMQLVLDNGIFYEWMEVSKMGSPQPPIPTWEVETGKLYKMIVSINAGLWRYPVNDLIEFQSKCPPVIKVCGRANEILDDFGEALSIMELEKTVHSLSVQFDFTVRHLAVAPIHPHEKEVPRHHWLFFSDKSLTRPDLYVQAVDSKLKAINRHYGIRRDSGALAAPSFTVKKSHKIPLLMPKKASAQSKPKKIISSREELQRLIEA